VKLRGMYCGIFECRIKRDFGGAGGWGLRGDGFRFECDPGKSTSDCGVIGKWLPYNSSNERGTLSPVKS